MSRQVSDVQAIIDQGFAAVRAELKNLKGVVGSLEEKRLESEKELKELNNSLPRLLADHALGRVLKSDLVKTKKRIAELREIIADIPVILEALKGEGSRIVHKGNPIRAIERKFNNYQLVKDEILDNIRRGRTRHNGSLKGQLLRLAADPELDVVGDAEKFIQELQSS